PIEAHATHDGYYQATVPIGAGRFAVGIQLGAAAEWLQIEEVAFHGARALHDHVEAAITPPIPAQILSEGMQEEAPGFYRCGEDGLLLVPPPGPTREAMVLSLVFRPIIRREQRALMQEAA
ncbi:MAG TPA: hypothetical protein VGB54_10140, partial [Allosphingosinicella sp.]